MGDQEQAKTGGVLVAVGAIVFLAGSFLFFGNKTGLFPTLAFAGGITTALGTVLASAGFSLIRGDRLSTGIEKRRTSPIIVVLALLLFVPLLAGAFMMLGDNIEAGASPGRWAGTATFSCTAGCVVFALVRSLVSRSRPT